MDKIERWDPVCEHVGCGEYTASMEKQCDGDYVSYSDHTTKIAQLQARTVELENLVKVLKKAGNRVAESLRDASREAHNV